MRMPRYIAAPANPGASATATLYDSGAVALNNLHDTKPIRVRIAGYINQDVTLYCKWAAPGSSNLRTFNGTGSGETLYASVFFEKDILVMPGRTQITIVTGTAPTTWELGIEEIYDQSMAQ